MGTHGRNSGGNQARLLVGAPLGHAQGNRDHPHVRALGRQGRHERGDFLGRLEVVGDAELVSTRRAAAAALLVPLLLTGCSTPAETERTSAGADDEPGWGDDLSRLRAQATTELEQLILADDRISEEERVAAEDAFVQCAGEAGFTVTDFARGGGYTIDGPFADDGPPALRACEGSFNRTSGQYWLMQRNPAGIDEAELMISCLVRAGVLDESFTRADYLEGLGAPPLTLGSSEFGRCTVEPTTAFTE